ncbi:MAG: DedA family protein [Rhodothalassiaceae bacterium]
MFDWITGFVKSAGYWAVALLMFVENVFPPIPSEIVMPLAGYSASAGELNIFLVIAAGSVGSLAGALFWYYVGALIGTDRLRNFSRKHGRWLTLEPKEVDAADRWFERHGGKAVFFGRLVPAVRTLISVPAGLSEMSFRRFLTYTTAGTVLWTALLAGAGYWLGSAYDQVQSWLNPVSNTVVAVILLWYGWRVATFRRRVSRTG